MNLLTDISIFIHIATVCISLLLSAVIASRKAYYQKANLFLILLLLVTAIVHINASLILSGYELVNVYFQNIQNAIGLLFGPALYFTTYFRLDHSPKKPNIYFHFIPFLVFLIVIVFYYSGFLSESGWLMAESIALVFFALQILVYLILTFLIIRKNNNPLFKTLVILVKGLFVIYVVQSIIIFYEIFVQNIPNVITLNVSLLFSFFVIAFAYKCLVNNQLLFESPKYSASTLSDQQMQEILKKIKALMKKEQLFTNPHLKLKDIGDRLEINPKYVSQSINNILNKNFHEFINEYRVDLVKKMMEDPDQSHFTLLALAQKVGFKSGSAFNSAFKKYTNMLPSAYRKEKKKEE